MVSMASHDIRGSVVSSAAALKLMEKGFYGKIDVGVSNEIEKLLEKMAGIIGIVEDSMSRSLCLTRNAGAHPAMLCYRSFCIGFRFLKIVATCICSNEP